jgi:DNA-binding NtrC family response regulator
VGRHSSRVKVFFLDRIGASWEVEKARVDEHQYVLIVDDDERVRFVLSRALRALEDGYRVETARSGEEALRKAKMRPYDIVITDIAMPGVDGVEVTEAIKDLYPDTVMIWITARGRQRFRADGNRLGVFRCLEKPIGIAEIRQVVVDAADHAESLKRASSKSDRSARETERHPGRGQP